MNIGDDALFQYQVGGSLAPYDPSYIKRQEDKELYKHLKAGEFCYVLNSRQTGKSSLSIQTITRLKAEEIICGLIDLTVIGKDVSSDGWYKSLFYELIKKFNLSINRKVWWNERIDIPPIQRLDEFVKEVLLKEVHQSLVIFIDEIDSVLSLNFPTEDFFIWIRACYNQRANNPDYQRLTFCLIGVATPNDLIQDKNRTPFNIGNKIELSGFTSDEASHLHKGLINHADNPKTVLKEILHWTGGQPFLTQKLCYLVVNSITRVEAGEEKKYIEELVQSKIIENWEGQDDPQHLRTIRDRLLADELNTILGLYLKILEKVPLQDNEKLKEPQLRLSGAVIDKENKLTVYNPIYEKIFDENFVDSQLNNLRPYRQKFENWLKSSQKDKSQLLTGKNLKEALQWKQNKKLTDDDNSFLNASQQQANRRAIWKSVVISIGIGLGFLITSKNVIDLYNWLSYGECPKGQIKISASLGEYCTKLYSSGENILFSDEHNLSMEDGVKAFKDGNYLKAKNDFQEAVNSAPKNAEPQIYLNNAEARQIAEKQGIKPLLVAVPIPITYKTDIAQNILRGVADAQTEFNKNQNKSPLEIIIANDINDSSTSKKIAAQIIRENPKILAVIGHYSSETTKSALPNYQSKNIPLITATATSPELKSSIFFRIPSDNNKAGKKLAQYARKLSLEKVAIFYDNESTFSKTMIDATFGDNYCNKSDSICFDLNKNINWEEKVKDLINEQQVQFLVLFPSQTTTSIAINIARAKAKAKIPQQKPLNFVGGDTLYSSKILDQDPSAFDGIVIPVSWHSDEWINDKSSYAKKAGERWKGDVNWDAAMAYDATQVIIASINSLSVSENKQEINRQNLLKELKTICLNPEQTSGDMLKFDEDGNSNRQARLVQWRYDKDQKRWTFKLKLSEKPSSSPSRCKNTSN